MVLLAAFEEPKPEKRLKSAQRSAFPLCLTQSCC